MSIDTNNTSLLLYFKNFDHFEKWHKLKIYFIKDRKWSFFLSKEKQTFLLKVIPPFSPLATLALLKVPKGPKAKIDKLLMNHSQPFSTTR
jgi:hypothetical protein